MKLLFDQMLYIIHNHLFCMAGHLEEGIILIEWYKHQFLWHFSKIMGKKNIASYKDIKMSGKTDHCIILVAKLTNACYKIFQLYTQKDNETVHHIILDAKKHPHGAL